MFRFHIKYACFFFVLYLSSCQEDKIEYKGGDELRFGLIESSLKEAKDKKRSLKERKESLKEAYAISSTLDDGLYKLNQFREISLEYYRVKDLDNFKKHNDKTLDLSIILKDSLNMAKSYFLNGLYYRNSDLGIAYENFDKSEKIYASFDKANNLDPLLYAYDHGKVLTDLAKILRKVKDYSQSEGLTIEAIKKFKLSKNPKYLPLCYTNLGILAKYTERYEASVDYHLQSIEYAKNTNKEVFQTIASYNNIGTVYKSDKKYKKAEEYYNRALSYNDFLNKNPKTFALLLDNLAYVKFLSNDNENIPEAFFESLSIRDSISDIQGISTNTLHLAEYYKSNENDSLAKSFAERAKNAALEVNNNEELLQSYELLSEVSDNENGLVYARKYIRLSDSLVKEERAFRDKLARIRFETEEKVQEIAAISREKELLIFAILGLSVLFLLGYVIFRQQQSNKELLFEQNQQQSNQEIYRLLLSQQLKLEEGRKLEQHRMSEELHDGVLGRLFGVRLSLDGINQRANDGFTESRNKYIDELKSIEKEIRLISHDLGTDTLSPDIAYVDVVESLVSDLCTVHKMEFAFANDENIDWETIDDQKKVNLFRIIQESLQNIFKHARAKSVKINFDYVDDKINLTILDDGIGFKSSKVKRGIGLKNITSRVTQMNGVVDFISNQDSGTKVSVGIPI
ncbi:tetratricopeptide repeat-containing sensor histidine kinase [uncultured Aquimarina sp.]|uniref:tetratricopeptide repeat-containing sensor histidine kinase n=1 Tax=uncultured Aquimarina sp. TaxID=575652 RepID=UPI00262C71C7|nr:tetratricopeptide repeat-containing sensor histidine kinase [uncultured Aquimarina sp.]